MSTTDEVTRGDGAPQVGGDAVGRDRPHGAAATPPGRSRRGPLRADQRRWLIAIVAVGGAAGGVADLQPRQPPDHARVGRPVLYWYYGNAIADGEGYISYVTGEATAYYPIGYPAILAGLVWAAERVSSDVDLMLVIGGFHAVVSAATVPLTFVVGRRLLGTTAGLVAAGLIFPTRSTSDLCNW